ncbi:uncharacterized protein PAC_00869 [Phialocephala subalpina]|uniref:Uncharacterized protein n=1 Tax=Phialocephala subalpina TaxID=576137 RepID=A0A1L7WE06_9HELO|nr:uncharacterized protein PAC_00869 [Phialocephala subalpina]
MTGPQEKRRRLLLLDDVLSIADAKYGGREKLKRTMTPRYESQNDLRNRQRMAGEKMTAPVPIATLWVMELKSREGEHLNPMDELRCHGAVQMPAFKLVEGRKDGFRRAEAGKWCLGCCAAYKRWLRMENGKEARDEGWVEGREEGLKPLERKMLTV